MARLFFCCTFAPLFQTKGKISRRQRNLNSEHLFINPHPCINFTKHTSAQKNKIMEFQGKLIQIGQLEQFETSRGTCLTRDIVVETDEQFPRTACFTLRNDLAQNFSHNIGEMISVRFDINARPNREGTRYYNSLNAWRIN